MKAEYIAAMEDYGDRARACERVGITLADAEAWRRADDEFRGSVGMAWEVHRSRTARIVKERVLGIVQFGAPEVQTFKGRIQYEYERDEAGQDIFEVIRDEDGGPVTRIDSAGNAHPQHRPKLKLDENGEPIPVVVRRYAEKTTLRLAESLGVLSTEDTNDAQRPGKDVVFLDRDGKSFSISEVIERGFKATKAGAAIAKGGTRINPSTKPKKKAKAQP